MKKLLTASFITALFLVSILLSIYVNVAIAQTPQLVAKRVEGSITVDGLSTEDVWSEAPSVSIPLSASTAGGGHVSSLTVKVAHNGSWIFILATWEDATGNIEHNKEVTPPELEDRFSMMWYLGGELMAFPCMRMGTNGAVTKGEVDLWHWHAARDNPDSSDYGWWGKFTPPHPYASDQYSNTTARYNDGGVKPYGEKVYPGFFDVWARGKWSNGVWILEIARKFNTADNYDAKLEMGDIYKVAFAVFDGGSGEDGEVKSTSSWYDLQISGEWLIPPLSQRVGDLETKVSNIESDISGLSSSINSLQSALNQLQSTVNQLSNSLSSLQTSLDDLQKKVSEIPTGPDYISLGIAIIALIIGLAAVFLGRKS